MTVQQLDRIRAIDVLIYLGAITLAYAQMVDVVILASVALFASGFTKIYAYQFLKKRLNEGVTLFGVGTSASKRNLLLTLLLGPIVLGAFFYFVIYTGDVSEPDWIFFSLLVSRFVDGLIPLSGWSLLIENNTIYGKKFLRTVRFAIDSRLQLRQVAKNKIEISDGSKNETLKLDDEEFEKLLRMIPS